MTALTGWVVLDKPLGLGSTSAVSAFKRTLRAGGYAKTKVGHGGTLDPLASGVLPIALGEATKLAGRMLDASKVYDFTIEFGMQTDTLDAEGMAVATSDVRPNHAQICPVLARFVGGIDQVPPTYSAIKVDGARAYDLARAGEIIDLPSRRVTISHLEASAVDDWFAAVDTLTLTAHVSKGTYIRSLARDIALALGTVGHVTMLRRTRAGPFGLDQAISLDNWHEAAMQNEIEGVCLPFEAGLDGIPALPLTSVQAGLVRQGRVLDGIAVPNGLYLGSDGAIPVALVEIESGSLRVVRGFNL